MKKDRIKHFFYNAERVCVTLGLDTHSLKVSSKLENDYQSQNAL